MDRKTETQLRQEIAEVWALLDAERAGRAALIRRIEQEEQSVPVEVFDSHCNYASFAGRVCNKCGRIHDGGKSVAVVGEPIYWIDPDDDANLSRIGRVGWSPLYCESPASIPAADLATLREKAAEADELRKDAERYRWLRDDAFEHSDDCFMEAGRLFAEKHGVAFDEAIDAAIAQEGEK